MLITEIQRFSLKDGPGIRSVVFFKGCNMSCGWCHNPETISAEPQEMFYMDNCIGCGSCKKGKQCFADARTVSGTDMTAEEIYGQISKDIPYYKNSGGGVTLSGGEVLVQTESACGLLKLCADNGIRTAIESNFLAKWETVEKLLPVTDLFMVDIKIMDGESHKLHTGADNGIILENLRRLDKTGKPFIVRTPVVPGVNADAANISQTADFLSGFINLRYYELLSFNPLGFGKYKALNLKNSFEGVKPLPEPEMKKLADIAEGFNITVRCGL